MKRVVKKVGLHCIAQLERLLGVEVGRVVLR